jgi:hypothetical protein
MKTRQEARMLRRLVGATVEETAGKSPLYLLVLLRWVFIYITPSDPKLPEDSLHPDQAQVTPTRRKI